MLNCFGQSNSLVSSNDDIFISSLKKHLLGNSQQVVYVQKKETIIESLPHRIKNYSIRLIDSTEFDSLLNKNDFILVSIFPIELKKDILSVRVIDYRVNKTNDNWNFSFVGGNEYFYKYDCGKKGFVYFKRNEISF